MRLLRCFGVLACSAVATVAAAQTYPTRPVTLVVTSAAGGATDVIARAVGQRLSEKWGQQVVVENRPGAGHTIGASYVMRATPDGYTLMVTEAGTVVVNPSLYAAGKLPYDPDKDFVPISGLVRGYMAMLSHPSLPARTVPELLALAKAKPGELSYGTASVGSSPHMSVVLLESLAKVKFAPVHYRGAAPALNDLIGNHINLVSIAPAIGLAAMRSGQIRMIGIAAPQRLKELPDVPTFIENGVAGYDTSTWFGMFAPAGTPQEIVSKVHDDVQSILTESEFHGRYIGPQVLQAMVGSVQQFVDDILAERKVWEKVVAQARIRIE